MNPFFAVVRKELRLYWNSPIAYVFLVAFLGLSFWLFFRGFFLYGQIEMRGFFATLPWIFLFLIPALTMRLWAEEYQKGTIETLLTSSVTSFQIVFAKFTASFFFLSLALLSTLSLPFSLSFLGEIDTGALFAAYIGTFLMGGGLLALGLFLSAITSNQIVAFIVSVLATFVWLIIGMDIATFALPGFLVPFFEFTGIMTHYDAFLRGVIDSRDVIFFCSSIFFFLFLNILLLQKRR